MERTCANRIQLKERDVINKFTAVTVRYSLKLELDIAQFVPGVLKKSNPALTLSGEDASTFL
jgi:hypothetical protein